MNGIEESPNGTKKEAAISIDKLKKQNQTLRNNLKNLSQALDEALDKQAKTNNPKENPEVAEFSENPEDKGVSLARIKKYKNQIFSMKKELEGNNEMRIADLENQVSYLKNKIQEYEDENAALLKIEQEQSEAASSNLNTLQINSAKVDSLKEELKSLKETHKDLLLKQKQGEKTLKDFHEKYVNLEEFCRKTKALIRQRKLEENLPPLPEVTDEEIRELEDKIKETEKMKKEEEGSLKKKIKELEKQIKVSKANINDLQSKLKEKDQECRATMLKIKELRRAVRQCKLSPINRSTNTEVAPRPSTLRSYESKIEIKRPVAVERYGREINQYKSVKSNRKSSSQDRDNLKVTPFSEENSDGMMPMKPSSFGDMGSSFLTQDHQ
ncbi:unnamed protein product [Blepharisma stoltei]|uniref:Lebercilin domain-containing protein n=1 Tax=Blepharisma stoltei TaxID=1481888 RepID=A0AAU9IRL4_9CILI|nr:unnamed protein product [Blepharisma stoltei]